MSALTRIAITGGGVSGTLTAIQLAKKLGAPSVIYMSVNNSKGVTSSSEPNVLTAI